MNTIELDDAEASLIKAAVLKDHAEGSSNKRKPHAIEAGQNILKSRGISGQPTGLQLDSLGGDCWLYTLEFAQ